MEKEKKESGRAFTQTVKDWLGRKVKELLPLPPSPPQSLVEDLVEKAISGNSVVPSAERSGNSTEGGSMEEVEAEEDVASADGFENVKTGGELEKDSEKEPEKRESCPYATKRAIVESLEEIRKFAEEHELASKAVKALLLFLAEAAVNALKGRVSGKVLEIILRGFTFEKRLGEAYKKGETEGRNARIETEYFPGPPAELPHINGTIDRQGGKTTIFDVAKQ